MHVAFINPQGNFDPEDSYWTAHPDFGGQLVYVKELALAMGRLGHHVDIVTRKIEDPDWPEFAAETDAYPGHENVRILRIPCGPPGFLPKEELWPHLGEWASRIAELYEREGLPDLFTGHYADGGLCAALLEERTGVPFSFTAHSMGAWKLDGLLGEGADLGELDQRYAFGARLAAERAAISRAAAIVTSGETERHEQYDHPAYRDVLDARDDRRFATIPPGVNLSVFDRARPGPREEVVKSEIRAAMPRDIA
ncbi:MAG: glycosyltransferase, partial [Rubrobacter sp.]|nr:glycosyltransferase [Rubrobacter sp.]